MVDAATTISTNIATGGTLSVTGASTLTGNVTAAASVIIAGTASTSALKVGDESVPTINGLSFGYCTFTSAGSFTASTTQYIDCTTTPTAALVAGDRVFVQATSSFDTGFIIEAASTTGVSTINLRVLNTGIQAADTTLGGTSINFWAVR